MLELDLLNSDKKAIVDIGVRDIVIYHRWRICKNGYIYACHNKETFGLHRYLLCLKKGDPRIADHINGNTLDNRFCNLRICSHLENMRNRKTVSKANTLGVKGVVRSGKKYIASIRDGKNKVYLGTFLALQEAARAYDKAAKELHGEFARLNFPETNNISESA